jgi:hypothetical protein
LCPEALISSSGDLAASCLVEERLSSEVSP